MYISGCHPAKNRCSANSLKSFAASGRFSSCKTKNFHSMMLPVPCFSAVMYFRSCAAFVFHHTKCLHVKKVPTLTSFDLNTFFPVFALSTTWMRFMENMTSCGFLSTIFHKGQVCGVYDY
ncbi:hypothetical protein ATANTOWER_010480 [Ataeniobius toweri]|uniref:Uncharacterized protein n=1 Tax=Ataeniobius toweri TaxID=208326 RepID=A0ABU7B8K1_9TELE|nr:hypothetical protein [Ataeniobius toweri]